MRVRIFIALLMIIAGAAAPASANDEAAELARRFLATIAPPGAKISFASADANGKTITIRDIVAYAQSADGEETVQRISQMKLQGLEAQPSSLFKLENFYADNIRIDGASELQGAGPGSVTIHSATAVGVNGGRIGALALSDIEISALAAGSDYNLRITTAKLDNVDILPVTRAAVRAHRDPQSARREDALLNSLLNTNSYGALHLRGVSVRKGKAELLSIAELNSDPDGNYAPFPASGNFSIHNASLDLRDPIAASLRQWLGQDRLQFDLESRHKFSAPASHTWDATLKLSPDAALTGTCSAQNLNGFSPALIRQAQAASGNSASLRNCDLKFTGTEFVNRWLALDGAKQGLNAEEARAKYLAGTLLVSLDPQTAGDPLAMQLVSASQIFLSQPSRLNLQLAPPGGLKFPDALATFGLLFQGPTEQKQQAMHKLGLSVTAAPLN